MGQIQSTNTSTRPITKPIAYKVPINNTTSMKNNEKQLKYSTYDPNYGPDEQGYGQDQKTVGPSIFMTMGPIPSLGPLTVNLAGLTCSTNEDCMHLDSYRSSPGSLVYMCPDATCIAGTCSCSGCVTDPSDGLCCQGLEKDGSNTFCIGNTKEPMATASANSDNNFWKYNF